MEKFINTPMYFWLLWFFFTLIGVLLGWVLRNATIGKGKREAEETAEQDRLQLLGTIAQLRESLDLKEADLQKSWFAQEEIRAQADTYEGAKKELLTDFKLAAEQLQNAQTELVNLSAKIESQEEQILGLRTRNAFTAGETAQLREEINAWKSLHLDFSSIQKSNVALEEAVAQLEQERNQTQQENSATYLEIDNLQAEILALQNTVAAVENGQNLAREATAPPPETEAEDLKIINGISPFSEQKLHELGVRSIAQISQWDAETTSAMNSALGLFPDRIEREDWVGQARHLIGQ